MNVAIVGAGGGIGHALVESFSAQARTWSVYAAYHRTVPEFTSPAVSAARVDATDPASIEQWAEHLPELDIVINAVGMLHTPQQGPEKTVGRLDPAFFTENMRVNAMPTLLLARFLRDKLAHGRNAVFATVSARVGSIADNRLGGWYSYRMSKAALNMGIKTLSIEWGRTLPKVAVVALHPGTTDTRLSKPFQRNVPREKLFEPRRTADYLVNVVQHLSPADTGSFLDYNGEPIPW